MVTNTFTVGGTVTGLFGTLVVQNNGADELSLTADGAFTFSTSIADGSTYEVTVLTQPAEFTCSGTGPRTPFGNEGTPTTVTI